MNPLTPDHLLRFASTLKGEELPTAGGRATFTVRVLRRGFEVTPRSTGKARVISLRKIEQILGEYEQSRSGRPGNYTSSTFDASYILTLIDRYLREERGP